jgi:hypothetical protein
MDLVEHKMAQMREFKQELTARQAKYLAKRDDLAGMLDVKTEQSGKKGRKRADE